MNDHRMMTVCGRRVDGMMRHGAATSEGRVSGTPRNDVVMYDDVMMRHDVMMHDTAVVDWRLSVKRRMVGLRPGRGRNRERDRNRPQHDPQP